nr:CDP-alcohol phosphatidyltransferase family protein [Agriterribacter humi]
MLSANLLNRTYYIVNGITLYRKIAAFLLILLIVNHQPEIFLTDAVDGCLARRYKVVSVLGQNLIPLLMIS